MQARFTPLEKVQTGKVGRLRFYKERRNDKADTKMFLKRRDGAQSSVNVDMLTMITVSRVKDPAMPGQVKEGDQISFVADKIDGAFTVTQVEVTH